VESMSYVTIGTDAEVEEVVRSESRCERSIQIAHLNPALAGTATAVAAAERVEVSGQRHTLPRGREKSLLWWTRWSSQSRHCRRLPPTSSPAIAMDTLPRPPPPSFSPAEKAAEQREERDAEQGAVESKPSPAGSNWRRNLSPAPLLSPALTPIRSVQDALREL
jgi:hypothetical protein